MDKTACSPSVMVLSGKSCFNRVPIYFDPIYLTHLFWLHPNKIAWYPSLSEARHRRNFACAFPRDPAWVVACRARRRRWGTAKTAEEIRLSRVDRFMMDEPSGQWTRVGALASANESARLVSVPACTAPAIYPRRALRPARWCLRSRRCCRR